MGRDISGLATAFLDDEVGGPAVEYSLVAALIAMTVLVGLLMMNSRIESTYKIITDNLEQ